MQHLSFLSFLPSFALNSFNSRRTDRALGGVYPFENDGGARRKFSKTPLKGTRISFCGRGFEFTITPKSETTN